MNLSSMAATIQLIAMLLPIAGCIAAISSNASESAACTSDDGTVMLQSLHHRNFLGTAPEDTELDAHAKAVARADALVRQMTWEEKYGMVKGVGYPDNTYNPPKEYFVGNTAAVPRLGIPSLNLQDNGQGYRTLHAEQVGQVTSWPSSLAVTATWDDALIERWAKALGKEFFAKGANVLLGPGLNVHRNAHNGRNVEYMSGESAYLGARLVPSYIRGLQSQHVLAVMKHFVTNSQETARNYVNSIVSKRTLWEVYYQPFIAAVRAGCAAAMCSYNLVNGVHACANSITLEADLKSAMGFEGWIMSDWWAAHQFAAQEGLDQEMPGNSDAGVPLNQVTMTKENVRPLNELRLNDMVRRMLTPMILHGLLEHPVCMPESGGCEESILKVKATNKEHEALARHIVARSAILLKNKDGVLPITPSKYELIAVLGSACHPSNDVEKMFAKWDLGNYYTVGGSGRVIPKDPRSIIDGLGAACAVNGRCELVIDTSDDVQESVIKANEADIAIICAAATSAENSDRGSLSVDQEEFVTKVSRSLEVPRVVVTLAPGSILMPWIDDVDAAINVFLAGQATGDGIADVLFGEVNPSAKSPVTFPLRETDALPVCSANGENIVDCSYAEGVFAGFPHYEQSEVVFPFGHGLSYTTFSYHYLEVGMGQQCPGDTPACVSARIANRGDRAGAEVAQLYLGFPAGVGEPAKVLRGFQRVELAPNEWQKITFPLRMEDIQIFDEAANAWRIPQGVFSVFVGSSSRDLRLRKSFQYPSGAACSETYSEDCRITKCCKESGAKCFEKNSWWASCRPSCQAGWDLADQGEDKEWSCQILSN